MHKLLYLFFTSTIIFIGCNTHKSKKKEKSRDKKIDSFSSFSDSLSEKYDSIYSEFSYSEITYSNSSSVNMSITSTSEESLSIYTSENNTIKLIERDIKPTRVIHNINTATSDYHPSISPDGKFLFFTGMDRSGFFDNKVDFTKTRTVGGEDIFCSVNKNGIWQDAESVKSLNANTHEAVTQTLSNGDLMITGNYRENMGPDDNDRGAATTDLFLAQKNKNYQLFHFEEPINSIFSELDGFMTMDGKTMLFASDRPGHMGKYHKKGWLWNDSYWGNTDIYVSFKEGQSWSVPKNIGNKINTDYSERTPWLSFDELTLFVSSNGYRDGKKDLDIYFFTRKNKNEWNAWEGPFEITNLNGNTDEWGYQEDKMGNGFFARALKLGFVPTKKGKDGTGFVFENNFRSGYEVRGLQSGSFQKDEQTDIFMINSKNVAFTLPDILFDVDSYKLNAKINEYKDEILDYIKINEPQKITIIGYTDSDGSNEHNITLSLNRANSVKNFIKNEITDIEIVTLGKGKENPVAPNDSKEGKQKNRRVEIVFN